MSAKLLFRQIHPSLARNGLSSSAFRPAPRDDDKLSVDCSDMTNAEASYKLHIQKTKIAPDGTKVRLESAGTWAITRDICTVEQLAVTPDPIAKQADQPENLAHHLIDFSKITGQVKDKNAMVAKRLRLEAAKLGKLWPKTD